MTYTVPTVHATGDLITAAQWNTDIQADVQWLATDHPMTRVYNSTNQGVTSATVLSVPFDSERFDNSTMHDATNTTTRITFATAGNYLIGGSLEIAAGTAGTYRYADIRLNGATSLVRNHAGLITSATVANACPVSFYKMAANDYIELLASQDSGGNLNVLSTANRSPEFWACWQST